MSQTYQARRRAPAKAPAEPAAPAYVPWSGRQDGGGLCGGTDVAPLSASAVPASAAGPMQAKKADTEKAEKILDSYDYKLPSMRHPFQRGRAVKEALRTEEFVPEAAKGQNYDPVQDPRYAGASFRYADKKRTTKYHGWSWGKGLDESVDPSKEYYWDDVTGEGIPADELDETDRRTARRARDMTQTIEDEDAGSVPQPLLPMPEMEIPEVEEFSPGMSDFNVEDAEDEAARRETDYGESLLYY